MRCVSLGWDSQSLEVDRCWWTEDGGKDGCCSVLNFFFSFHYIFLMVPTWTGPDGLFRLEDFCPGRLCPTTVHDETRLLGLQDETGLGR